MPKDRDPAFERRLDELRQAALANGRVNGRGVDVAGSPLPISKVKAGPKGGNGQHIRELSQATQSGSGKPGYFGLAALKAPVWTWEISAYFFVGGLTGMAAVIATATTFLGHPEITRAAMWIAFVGGVLSPALLIMDLGRPLMFLNMLRIFKPQSAMSMGVYILTPFGMTAIPGALAVELTMHDWLPHGFILSLVRFAAVALTVIAGLSGMLLATYTGVLIGATAIPAWNRHHSILPLHFGTAGLGSAAATLTLIGDGLRPLDAILWVTAAIETCLWLWLMFRRHGAADRALHEGTGGMLLMPAEILLGPVSLVLLAFGLTGWMSGLFLFGAMLSRIGWIQAGKVSARDPEAAFASQR